MVTIIKRLKIDVCRKLCLLVCLVFYSFSIHADLGIKSISIDSFNTSEYTKIKREVGLGKIGHIAINMPWFDAIVPQDASLTPLEFNNAQGCESRGYVAYQYNPAINRFRCYDVSINKNRIRELHALGAEFTFLLWGVPPEYGVNTCALKDSQEFARFFCAPASNRIDDFGDYAGMLAQQFRGLVDNYVIHNEVNANLWFNYDCISATNCDWRETIRQYAKNFNDAYDKILRQYGSLDVSVLLPLAGEEFLLPELAAPSSQFRSSSADQLTPNFDLRTYHANKLNGISPTIMTNSEARTQVQRLPETVVYPVNRFIDEFANYTNTRKWKVAPHAHPIPYASSSFSYGLEEYSHTALTLGNMGMFAGYLHKKFPQLDHVWNDIHVTEVGLGYNGINSSQIVAETCKAFAAILATPGISAVNWWYRGASSSNLDANLGIIDNNGVPRPQIYNAFHAMNSVGNLSCGFELFHDGVLHTKIERGNLVSDSSRHVFSSRPLTSRFNKQHGKEFYLPRSKPAVPAKMLYECAYSEFPNTSLMFRTILSTNNRCVDNGLTLVPMGPVGYAYTQQQDDTVALYQCLSTGAVYSEIFTTNTSDCASGSIVPMNLFVRKLKPNGKLELINQPMSIKLIEYDDYLIPIVN